jgi:Nucleotide modification associated domain 1
MSNTETAYKSIIKDCKNTFIDKVKDYGTSWRVMRPISITDQIYIKAMRVRQLQVTGITKVGDGVEGEFKAMINYGIIACIQLELNDYNEHWQLASNIALDHYNHHSEVIFNLMMDKNHDYGEAWRSMSVEGITDMILTKILRIRQILANEGQTLASEGIEANFHDIVNYSVFALILMDRK